MKAYHNANIKVTAGSSVKMVAIVEYDISIMQLLVEALYMVQVILRTIDGYPFRTYGGERTRRRRVSFLQK